MNDIKLDPYVITNERIGKGAFSTIYKGFNKLNNQSVAIKEINYDNNKSIKAIASEFEILKNLSHENIIRLHETYYDKKLKNIYLVLDYYSIGDLKNYLNNKTLKENYCRKYMKQLSNGLNYLYDNNIIHRDLKPQNILVSDSYVLKITDFGFARYVNNDILIKTICGSPMYMAPEIIKYKKYNNKSDLWSVGIIMYEMLFGCTPFKSSNFIELIKDINKYKFNIPSTYTVSIECRELLFKLLQKNPENRIQWKDFFNNKWFIIVNDDNKLLDFSINEFADLPNYKKLVNNSLSKEFNSFRHNSIKEKDIFDNKNIVMSINSSAEISSSEDEDEFFDSNDQFNLDNNDEKFINIKPNNTIHITSDMLTNEEYKFASDPTLNKSITNSLKEYLYSSLDFFKQSYNYIKSL